MKKFISLLLSLTMLLSILSVVDFSAYADTLTTGKCGDNVTYSLDTSTGVLTINGEGDMENYNYNNYKNNPFYKKSNIKTVIIKNGVTSIGSYAFEDCTSLTSVTIPNSVTSIGDWAFDGCTSLTSVTIPNSVTSIGSSAFRYCTSLANITIPDSVINILDNVFIYCDSLTSIEVSGNNKNYSSVDGVLFNKDKSELITYPAGKTDSEYAIPNDVTSIGSCAFDGCTSLTSVAISDSVTSIGSSAFSGCTNLTSVTIPNSVNSIGGWAFCYCESLTDVYYNGTKAQWKSISIYYTQNSCLTSAVIHCNDGVTFENKSITQDNVKYVVSENNAYVSGYSGNPNSVRILDKITYGGVEVPVTSIVNKAFENCKDLESVTIPDSVASIGDYAFRDCTSLTTVTIGNSLKDIHWGTFYNCRTLKSITMPDSITDIAHYAFYNCASLTDVYYSGTKAQWKSISVSTYNSYLTNAIIHCSDGCIFSGEITVTIDGLKYKLESDNTASVVGYTGNPKSVNISKTITYANETLIVTSIGSSAFLACESLTSITIPDSVNIIGDFAFSNCNKLTSIIIFNKECSLVNSGLSQKTEIISFYGSQAINYAKSNGNPYSEINCNDYGLEHSYESQILTKPTCKEKGLREFTCSRCSDKYTEEIAPLGGEHIYKSEIFKEPTCTEKGTTRYTCTRCGDSYDKEDISALGHNYVSKVLTQPTCTENGTTRYTCSRCGDTYDVEVDAMGGTHNYVSNVLAQPTCTEKGTTRYTCSRCGDSYDKEDIAALGHNYVSKVLTQPTCTEKGTTRYTCTRCNNYYDKEDIEELGHDTKIVERVEPTLTEDGFYRVECQRDGCGYSSSHPLEQLTLGYNQKVKSNGSDTYKIEMDKSGYLIFDFEGESKKWDINIYDEDYNKIDTLKPVYKEFYKKSYLQISLGSNVPNQNQIAALFAGKYYVEIDRLNDDTNDNFSGNYTFSIDYSPANETIKETKNDFYYDAPTAKNIELNKTYNGFLGAKYACYNYVGNPILTTDERDAYKIEIPKGSGLSQFSVTLSSKAFAPLGSNCTLILYNSEFEPYDGFKPLTVSLNSTLNETIYLYEGTYYIAVVNDNSPIEYTFTTTFKPQGTFTCVEHKGKLVNTVNPTCTQNGYNSYVCQICGTQYKEIIPAYGHNVVIDYEVAPTVVSSGLTRGSHCSICGAVITPQTVIPQISAPAQPTTTPTTAAKAVAKPVSKPKSAKIKKVKAAKKAVSVEWKKVSGVKGYQVQVATDKKFKKNKKTATVKKQKTTKVTIKKLKAKKKYYVRIRTYKTVKGKKVYSSWSKVKTIKTK